MFYPKSTVFIIGAGASWHYGYPTGEPLVQEVRKRAGKAAKYFTMVLDSPRFGYMDVPDIVSEGAIVAPRQREGAVRQVIEQCEELASRLETVDPLVIDYFLGLNPAFATIGKWLIASVILDVEATKGNQNRPAQEAHINDNWCRFIINRLVSNCPNPSSLLDNRVTFITFNYDVSLERQLYNALCSIQHFYNDNVVEQFFRQTPIVHVYGSIRENPFAPRDGGPESVMHMPDTRDRVSLDKARVSANRCYTASKGIRTIAPDEKSVSEDVERARKSIANGDRIFILGYGFDEENNKLLELDTHLCSGISRVPGWRRKEVFFTNFTDINTVNKSASRMFFGNPTSFLSDKPAIQSTPGGYYEKSCRNVYDALAVDFDWRGDSSEG